jgi:tRNA threonylcarbamoyladenosine biosynthesis protein TsaB
LKLLALDTSTEHCSVAFLDGGEVLQRLEHAGQRHSELLLPMVHAVLAEAGTALGGVDALACSVGPGSFTGLRIATAVAQGLAFGAGLPVIPVSTLEALAAGAAAPRVVACLDARMGEVYAAAYDFGDGAVAGREVLAARVCPPAELEAPPGNGWVGCGNGFARHGEALARALGEIGAIHADRFPEARWVARLAAKRAAAGERHAPEALVPVYLRDRVALTRAER